MSKMNSTYKRLLHYTRPYALPLFFGVVLSAVGGISITAVLQAGEDLFETLLQPEAAMQETLKYAWLLFLLGLLFAVLGYVGALLIHFVGYRVTTNLRAACFARLQELSLDFYGRMKTGDLISRVSNDTNQVQQAVSNTVSDMVKEPFVLIGVTSYLVQKLLELEASWFLLSFVVTIPLCILPVIYIGRRVKRYSKQNQEHMAGMVNVLQENISGIRIVKAFGMEGHEQEKFSRENERVFSRLLKMTAAKRASEPLMLSLAAFSIALALVYVKKFNIAVDDFFIMGVAIAIAYEPIKKLGRIHMVIQQSEAPANRLFEILDTPITVADEGKETLEEPVGEIRFEQVGFSYGDEPVLQEVSFSVQPGQCVAFAGHSGAGKTTLVNLIPRFYDPTSGQIVINGKPLTSYTLSSLRKHIAVVSQDTFLFNDTIAGNIAYGQKNPDRGAIEEAAKKANAHAFIQQLPQGYDTPVGDRGVRLSGGQRQRLSIARALFRNAPILILDEATSALDTESERLVQGAIDQLMKGRTVFAIAHRLSTIRHAHCIYVLKEGRMVEHGDHDALLDQQGYYHYLHGLQYKEP